MHRYVGAVLIFVCIVLAAALYRAQGEEAWLKEHVNDKEWRKAVEETTFGNFWGCTSLGFHPEVMVVDMRAAFENERAAWRSYMASDNPFSAGFENPKDAIRSCYLYWLGVQMDFLGEKGWKVQGSSGDTFVFQRPYGYESFKYKPDYFNDRFARAAGEIGFREAGPVKFTFPFHRPRSLDVSLKKYKYDVYYYQWYQAERLVIPPGAYAIRIFSPVALSADRIRIGPGDYLNKPAFQDLYSYGYDMDAENVLTLRFNRTTRLYDRFWRWKTLVLKLATKYEGDDPEWMAWEFLGPDGEPLPECVSPPTRYFPEGFDKHFKFIPLPGDLPQVQD